MAGLRVSKCCGLWVSGWPLVVEVAFGCRGGLKMWPEGLYVADRKLSKQSGPWLGGAELGGLRVSDLDGLWVLWGFRAERQKEPDPDISSYHIRIMKW